MKKILTLILTILMLVTVGTTSVLAEDSVAKIENTNYASLETAINAVTDGQTIVLLKDIVATKMIVINNPGVDFCIDLNGKTIERTDGSIFDIYSKVTFKDTSLDGTGTIKAHGRALYGNEGADFTLESGTVIGTEGSTINVIGAYGKADTISKFTMNGGTVKTEGENSKQSIYMDASDHGSYFEMNGGTIQTSNDYVISGWANNESDSLKITINAGTIEATGDNPKAAITVNGSVKGSLINISGGSISATNGAAIYYPNQGTLNISGGTFNGTEAIVIKSGVVTITGGVFTANGASIDPTTPGESAYAKTGDTIYVEDNYGNSDYAWKHTVELNISGGEFISKNSHALSARFTTDERDGATVNITGGKFASTSGKEVVTIGNGFDGTITASAGIFTSVIADTYIATSYACVANTDKTTNVKYPYMIGVKNNVSADYPADGKQDSNEEPAIDPSVNSNNSNALKESIEATSIDLLPEALSLSNDNSVITPSVIQAAIGTIGGAEGMKEVKGEEVYAYLEQEIVDIEDNKDNANKIDSFTVDITPMYVIKAVGRDASSQEVTAVISQPKVLKVNRTILMRVYLPQEFVTGLTTVVGTRVYVKHKGNVYGLDSDTNNPGGIKIQKEGDVGSEKYFVEFYNPDGFSEFEFSLKELTPDPKPSNNSNPSYKDETCETVIGKDWTWDNNLGVCKLKGYRIVNTETK